MNLENQTEAMEFDLLRFLHFLKKKAVLIIAVFVVFALAGFFGTKIFISPQYVANTRIYVLNKSAETSVVSADFTVANNILSDYKVLITGQNVTKEVVDQLNLDMKPDALSGKISVTSPANTRVLQINVTDTDPQMAADIANAVREVASEQVERIMDVDAVQTVYEADVPKVPSGPSAKKNALMAGAVGFVLVVGVCFAVFVLDDTIRTEEDVAHYLDLSVLGVIPVSLEMGAMDANRLSKKKYSKKNKPAQSSREK